MTKLFIYLLKITQFSIKNELIFILGDQRTPNADWDFESSKKWVAKNIWLISKATDWID